MHSTDLHRRLLLAAALAVALVLASPASASALTFGLDWDGNNSPRPELLEAVEASGATVYHAPLAYNGAGGDWTGNDEVVEEAWERGLTILPTMQTEGRFLLSSDPEWKAWGAWLREAVERYGPNGTFWEGKVNPTPITAWEVWNEPNIDGPVPRPEEAQRYGVFLDYSAEQIQSASLARSGSPTDVLFGALNTQVGESFEPFLAGAEETGGLSPNVTGVAIHPYSFAGGVAGMAADITTLRAYLDTMPEGSAKSLWITEMGWPTKGEVPFGAPVDPGEEATLLTRSLEWIKSEATAMNIQLAVWYNARDFGGPTWDGHSGLLTEDGSYKPAWYAFQRQTGAEISGGRWAAFQADTGKLWTWSTAAGYHDTGVSMLPGSSPTIAAQPGGGALVSFQAPDGAPATYSTGLGSVVTGLAAEPDVPEENFLSVAFKAYLGSVWPTSDVDGAFGTTARLAPGTVPSVDSVP